jgi:23S rRNA A2030 N6-methylase RlmJ
MAYDHSDKIGNQGDLVKHYALYLCLKQLLDNHPANTPFIYAESHAGWPEYVLPKGGGWKQGIGAFSKIARGRNGLKGTGLGEFDEIFIGRKLKTGMKYLGSTGIAFRLLRGGAKPLRQHGQPFTMKLWEQSLPAVEDLTRYYHPWMQPHLGNNPPPTQLVEINPADGFSGVQTAGKLNFVLIDPPSIKDAEKVFTLITHLHRQQTPYLCWMPRTSKPDGKGNGASESKPSRMLAEKLADGGICDGVRWHKWGHPFPGCWLAGSNGLGERIKTACDEIRSLMNWFG